jgi:hypothetical protein
VSADTHQEKRDAVAALAHRIRNIGDTDPEVFALEFITAMWGRGWRPTETRPFPWRPRTGPGAPPSAAYLKAKEAMSGTADPAEPVTQDDQPGGEIP